MRSRAALHLKPHQSHSQKLVKQAVRAMQRGDLHQALADAEDAVRHGPNHFDALHLLGFVHRELGRSDAALDPLERAVVVNPASADALANLGGAYTDLGRVSEAELALRRALSVDPAHADALGKLAVALLRDARVEEAKGTLVRAIQANPTDPILFMHIASLMYDDRNVGPAIEALEGALSAQPGFGPALYHLAVLAARLGDAAGAEALMSGIEGLPESYRSSWEYVRKHASTARSFGTTWATLEHAIEACTVEGVVLEFGVRFGASTRFIASHTRHPIHGFDSLEGIPEDWGPEKAGAYSTHGELPEVPEQVTLHAGWFEDTLPTFVESHSGPIRLLHVDCDLYNSTKTIFDHLAEWIVPGTVIVFDEYLVNATWTEDEFRAFQEAVAVNAWSYEYLGYSLFSKQASVLVTGAS